MAFSNRMNILHINTNDLRGGAAKVAYRLAEAQNRSGHHARLLVGYKESSDPLSVAFPIERNSVVHQLFRKNGWLDLDLEGSNKLTDYELVRNANILHVHNLHGGYFNPASLSKLASMKPIVWTLHDMFPITGHCSYSFECDGWKRGCGNCPDLSIYPQIEKDTAAELWELKKEIYASSEMTIVVPSKWLKNKVENSILGNHRIELIYNGVNLDIFKPKINKTETRRKYGIADDAIVIGCVANGGISGDSRKGGFYIREAANYFLDKNPSVIFLNVGSNNNGAAGNIVDTGYIDHEESLADVYNAMDIFLFPSLADNCPLVISEALGCGLPIVTFDVGGIPELVLDGQNGFISKQGDVLQTIRSLERLVDDAEMRKKFGVASLNEAVQYDHSHIVNKYEELYDQLTKNDRDFSRNRKVSVTLDPAVKMVSVSDILQVTNEQFPHAEDYYLFTREGYDISERSLKSIFREIVKPKKVIVTNLTITDENGRRFFKHGISIQSIINGKVTFDKVITPNILFHKEMLEVLDHDLQLKIMDFPVQELLYLQTGFASVTIDTLISDKLSGGQSSPVFIYGAGQHTSALLAHAKTLSGQVAGVIDSDPSKAGKEICNLPILHVLDVLALENKRIVISSATYESEIYFSLIENMDPNHVIRIYGDDSTI